MNTTLFFKSLQDNLSEIDQKFLISSLKQDKLILQHLRNDEFFLQCIETFGKKIDNWSLGKIALLTLEIKPEILEKEIKDKFYLKNAISILDETFKNHPKEIDFQRASLNALALFERKRKNQSWNGLISELLGSFSRKSCFLTWRTSLSILFSLLKFDDELLLGLLNGVDHYLGVIFVNHIVASQFIKPEEKAKILVRVFELQPIETQIIWLQSFSTQIYHLKDYVSSVLANSKMFRNLLNNKLMDPQIDFISDFNSEVNENLLSAFRYQLENSPVQAKTNFIAAKNRLQNILRLIDINIVEQLELSSSNEISTYMDDPIISDLIYKRHSEDNIKNLSFKKENQNLGILSILTYACDIQKNGDTPKAREIAERQFKNWFIQQQANWPSSESISYLSKLNHKQLIQLLNTLGLNGLSADYLAFLSSIVSIVDDLQPEVIDGLQTLNLNEDAYSYLKISLFETGNSEKIHRQIIEFLDKNKEWVELFGEWDQFSKNHTLSQEDWMSYASVALNANELDTVEALIEKMRAEGVNKVFIDLIFGKLLFKQGKLDQARSLFEETTKRLPENEEGWILLSNIYKELGSVQKSMDTLRSASLCIPNSSDIHFNLASINLEQELFSEALPYLRKSVSLEPNNAEYHVSFIKTLQTLGRNDEADSVLNQARTKWPKNREIAYLDAIRQVEKQNRTAAIDAFEVVIGTDDISVSFEKKQLFVQTLLGDQPTKFLPTDGKFNEISNLIKAQKILQQSILNHEEETKYLQLVLAEVYYLVGELEASNSIYSKLVNDFKTIPEFQALLWRVYAGLGLVKIEMQEIDGGIAALQEADQLNAKHLGLKQKIAETYLSAKLTNQAETKADEIYQLGSTNIENLLWYASFMGKIGNFENELKGLEQVLHFDPINSFAITRLADIYISKGDIGLAREVLSKLSNNDQIKDSDIQHVIISYLRIGDFENALDWFSKQSEPANERESQNHILDKIYLLMQNKNWDHALADLQTLKRYFPNSRTISAIEGECLYNQEDFSAAIYAFDVAISFNPDHDQFVQDYLKMGGLIPSDWLTRKSTQIALLTQLTNSYKLKHEFDQALAVIDRIIKINPLELWIYLLGAELSIELTEFDLSSDYLLKFKTVRAKNQSTDDLDLLATALDYACAYIDGRDYHFSFKPNTIENTVSLMLKAHQMLDNNLFEEALRLFKKIDLSIFGKNSITSNEQIKQVENSAIERLLLLLAWRLHEYQIVDEFFQKNYAGDSDDIEKLYLQLAITLSYQAMDDVFMENQIKSHRSKFIEKKSDLQKLTNDVNTIIKRYGTTKALKNLDQVINSIQKREISNIFGLLNSKTLPNYLNNVLVQSLMKTGDLEILDDYVRNVKPSIDEMMIILNNNKNSDNDEKLSMLDSQTPSDNPVWLIVLSKILEQKGDISTAIELAEQASTIWHQEEGWKTRLAHLYQEVGNIEKANETWVEIIEHSSKLDSVLYQYTDLLINNGKGLEVLQLLERYKDQIPESFDYLLTQAKAFALLNKFDKCDISIQLAKKIKPNSYELEYLEAELFYLKGDIEKSKVKVRELLEKLPGFEKGYILNAKLHRESGKYVEAIKIIDSGLGLCNLKKGLYLEKIHNLRQLKEFSKGLLIASDLYQNHPGDTEVMRILAQLYFDIDDFQAAEVVSRKSLHLRPNQSEMHYLLGQIAKRQGQLDQALDHFIKAGLSDQTSLDPWLEIGDIYIEQQQSEKAIDAYKEVYSRNEKDYRGYYKTGLLLRDLKDYEGAEKMLRIASSLSPKDANIRRQLAGVIALNLVHSA